MGSSKDIRAGRAYVELGSNDSALVAGLNKAAKRLKDWGSAVTASGLKLGAISGAILAPLAATTKVYAEMGDQLAKASARTGISVEALSALGYAADQSGADFETLEGSIRKSQKFLVEAAKGSAAATETLDLLGVSLTDLKGLSPDKQFIKLGDAISRIKDPAIKAALAMEVFGKSGVAMLPLFTEGAAGVQALADEAQRLGLIWSTQDAKAAEEFGDRMDDLWHVVKMGTALVGSALAPVLREAAVELTQIGVGVSDLIRRNRDLIAGVFLAVAGIFALSGAMVVFGTVLKSIGTVLSLVAGTFSLIGSIAGGAFSLIAAVAAAALSPLGLLIITLGSIGVMLLYVSGVGAQVLNFLGTGVSELSQFISDAVASVVGYFASAFQNIYGTVSTVFRKTGSVSEAWAALVAEAGYFVRDVWVRVKEQLVSVWIGFKGFFSNLWLDISEVILSNADRAASGFLAIWSSVMDAYRRIVNAASNVLYDAFYNNLDEERKKQLDFIDRNEQKYKDTGGKAGLSPEQARVQRGFVDPEANLAVQRRNNEQALNQQYRERQAEIAADSQRRQDELRQKYGYDKERLQKELGDEQRTNAAEQARAKAENDAAKKAYEESLKGRLNLNGPDLDPFAKAKADRFKGLTNPDDLQSGLDGLAKRTVTVVGTFSAYAAKQLGNDGGYQARVAKATESAEKVLKDIAAQVAKLGFGFTFG